MDAMEHIRCDGANTIADSDEAAVSWAKSARSCGGRRVGDRGVVQRMGAKETSPAEERHRPEDDPSEEARDRTQGRASLPAGLDRVQVAARGSRHTRFTALLHHVDEAALLRAFQR